MILLMRYYTKHSNKHIHSYFYLAKKIYESTLERFASEPKIKMDSKIEEISKHNFPAICLLFS